MKGGAGVPGLALAAILSLAASPVAAQEASPYSIKPSDVVVPESTALGSYRRVIHPFENWNLICDEDLQARKKVCNISQSFIDPNQAVVFSWSLAGDEGGKPFMILRAPAHLGSGSNISLIVPGREKPVEVQVEACDASVCIGYVPVGPILREQISKETTVQVTYSTPTGATVSLNAPFKGLKTALSAIN